MKKLVLVLAAAALAAGCATTATPGSSHAERGPNGTTMLVAGGNGTASLILAEQDHDRAAKEAASSAPRYPLPVRP